MGMMNLLLEMSNSDRCCPAVPGDHGWNHSGESWMGNGGRTGEEEDNTLGMTQKVSITTTTTTERRESNGVRNETGH